MAGCLFSAAHSPYLGKTVVLEHMSLLYSKVTGYNIDKIFVVVDKILHVGIF